MFPQWIPTVLVLVKAVMCCCGSNGCDNNCTTRKDILDWLLNSTTYDPSIAPHYELDIPTNVTVQLGILTIHSVSEGSMDFSVDLFLRQKWKDPRLEFHSTSVNMTLELDSKMMQKVWVPDTYFSNEKEAKVHDVTVPNKLMHLSPDGSVFYSLRISLTLSCQMYLHKYPLDSQVCSIEIESYTYSIDNVNFEWFNDFNEPVTLPKTETPQFDINDIRIEKCTKYFNETGTFAYLRASLTMTRNVGYYIVQIFIPSVLIVSLSWLSFWLDMEAVPARISLGVLTVLTMTTQSSGSRESLPRVSYVTAIDVWMAVCLVFVFAALLEFAYVNVLQRRRSIVRREMSNTDENVALNVELKVEDGTETTCCECMDEYLNSNFKKRARMLDKAARVIFPITFVVFNCLFWAYYIFLHKRVSVTGVCSKDGHK